MFWDICAEKTDEVRQSVRTIASGSVGSRANHIEAKHATDLAVRISAATDDSSIAILSWYNSQVALVKGMLWDRGHKGIHVGTISAAQGSEWNYVILSAVRTRSSDESLGILSDANILNVALTRSRLGLVIMCDRRALRRSDNWSALADDCEQRHLMTYESPDVVPRCKADQSVPQHSPRPAKVTLCCRPSPEDEMEKMPTLNTQKLSEADFAKMLQRSDYLASYGKAKHFASQSSQSAQVLMPKQRLTVAAHKGVLFGASKKLKSWRAAKSSRASASASPENITSTSRSRSRNINRPRR